MALPQPAPQLTAAEYLTWESEQPGRHEYFHGETFAMGGASRRHVTVSGNVFAALDRVLENTPCRAYMADMKLLAHADHAYFYPDVFVTCDPADHQAEYMMRAPIVVFEVLSPTTAAYDRGDKFAAYRRISSLREFILIDPDKQRIEHYHRSTGNTWELRELEPGQPLNLPSLDAEIPAERIFRNLD